MCAINLCANPVLLVKPNAAHLVVNQFDVKMWSQVMQLRLTSSTQLMMAGHGPTRVSQPRSATVTCVFVDHKTRHIFLHFQHSTSTSETLVGKRAYETNCKKYGRQLQHMHADNKTFNSAAFIENADSLGQTQSFCGGWSTQSERNCRTFDWRVNHIS